MRLERRAQAIKSRGVEIGAALSRAVYGVAECLRGFVGELSRPKCFEPGLAIVERILRDATGAIELLFQSIK